MDFPVEAKVHLGMCHNETVAREILRAYGFTLTDLGSDRVLVKGSFLRLKAAKAVLEPLINSQTKTDITPSSSSLVPTVSSGAVPKHHPSSSSDGYRSRSGSRNKPPHASQSSPKTSSPWASGSPNNHQTSPEHRASFSPRPDQRSSVRPEGECFIVDGDVFTYADRLRRKEIEGILNSHEVTMGVQPVGDSFNLTLVGKNAGNAVGELQSLLNNLNKSLRTQEVPLKDMDRDGRALLGRIKRGGNTHYSVFVCEKNDKLQLIGPSGESYELKQRLLGRPVDRSGRTGRTMDKTPRGRSSSLPPISRKNTGGDNGAVANPPPAGAAGYTPSKYPDDKREGREQKGRVSKWFSSFRRRSHSESRQKSRAGRVNDNVEDTENRITKSTKSPKKGFIGFLQLPWKNMKRK
ncbi:uncharacterized protein LOC127358188 [Dicentrarchus labrax]|uniref:uncharacterized protein LOC127358188 n=1 Tax=Dicentrarchus labrax TaxID=13489 RepID=UPI0021F5E94A|nr:uncharacterized protein LOC127358188 [Dicentrarchus labrax]XP_051247067.1 uncharacterized protein LOC127358188 [Dicentrarchus labrax]